MIFSRVNQIETEKQWVPGLAKAFDVLQHTDFSAKEAGTYEVDGKRLYYMIQEGQTKPESEVRAEAHTAYIDIQYLLSGEETIYVSAARDHARIFKDQMAEKDYVLYDDRAEEIECNLKAGHFAVFFPTDAHRPMCATNGRSSAVRKVVFKVASVAPSEDQA